MSYRIITAKELRNMDKEEIIGLIELAIRVLKQNFALDKKDVESLLAIIKELLDVVEINLS